MLRIELPEGPMAPPPEVSNEEQPPLLRVELPEAPMATRAPVDATQRPIRASQSPDGAVAGDTAAAITIAADESTGTAPDRWGSALASAVGAEVEPIENAMDPERGWASPARTVHRTP